MKQGKIIYLITISLIKGGAENQLVKLAVDLKHRGNTVKIISILPENDFEEILRLNQIENIFLNIRKINFFYKIIKVISRNKPDVLISFMYGANMIGRYVKFFTGIPLITSVRNNEIDRKFFYMYRLTNGMDSISTFNSKYALDKFINLKLTKKNKSFLINNAIDIPEIEVFDVSDKDIFVITSMAHFRPQKDYKTLIEAIKLLKERGIVIKLYILGHLYNQNWPFELIDDYELNKEIDVLGFKKNTRSYLKKSDLVVLSSLWEGTPNALLEGMANGLPVISSDIPGCRELVNNSRAGLLFQMKNKFDLANKIEMMIKTSIQEKQVFSANGYNYVRKNYSKEIVYDRWNLLIKKAIKSESE